MTDHKHARRPRLSTILAGAALFAALGGSAYAAKEVIDGGDIAKGTVASKQIKNETVKVKDLNKKTIAALAGNDGKDGTNGTNGTNGVDGKDGIVAPLIATGDFTFNVAQERVVLPMTPPAGKYMVTAKLIVFSSVADDDISCGLSIGGDSADSATWTVATAGGDRTTLPLQGIGTVAAGEKVEISCHPDSNPNVSINDASIIATPIQG